MTIENVQTIIGRAIIEAEYRSLLFDDPGKALEGYDLTEEEAQALKSLERQSLEPAAQELEERLSRAAFIKFVIGGKKFQVG